jgi:hypothetical protein
MGASLTSHMSARPVRKVSTRRGPEGQKKERVGICYSSHVWKRSLRDESGRGLYGEQWSTPDEKSMFGRDFRRDRPTQRELKRRD